MRRLFVCGKDGAGEGRLETWRTFSIATLLETLLAHWESSQSSVVNGNLYEP